MKSLANKRIVITRADGQGDAFAERLRTLGAQPLLHPAIAIAPPTDSRALDAAIAGLTHYDWLVFTSANAVRSFGERLAQTGITPGALHQVAIAAIGPATTTALAAYGLQPTLVPVQHSAEGLLAEFGDVAGQRVLLPAADIARDTLATGLRAGGATVDVVTAYRTIPGPGGRTLAPMLHDRTVDAVTFTSSSTVRYLLGGIEQTGVGRQAAVALLNRTALVCIGPVTAETACAEGLVVTATAETYTTDGLVNALVAILSTEKHT